MYQYYLLMKYAITNRQLNVNLWAYRLGITKFAIRNVRLKQQNTKV